MGVGFAPWLSFDCNTLVLVVLVAVEALEGEVSLIATVDLAASGFLGAVDDVGFLVVTLDGGRLTSFFAAAAVLGGCTVMFLPVDGNVATREAVGLEVDVEDADEAAVVFPTAVLDRDVVGGGLDAGGGLEVRGAVAGLEVFEAAAPKALVVVDELDFEGVLLSEDEAPPTLGLVEVVGFERVEDAVLLLKPAAPPTDLVVVEELDFGRVEATVLLAEAEVLGLTSLAASAPGLFLNEPFPVVGLVPFDSVAAAAEVVLAGPAGFLSGTRG